MSRIRGKDTNPEMVVRRYLHSRGFRYRLHRSDLPGKPDLVLPKLRVAIFVNGCFWHQHEGCPKATIPQSNVDFWQRKLSQNVMRDSRNQQALKDLGWHPMVVWECQLDDVHLKRLVWQLNEIANA